MKTGFSLGHWYRIRPMNLPLPDLEYIDRRVGELGATLLEAYKERMTPEEVARDPWNPAPRLAAWPELSRLLRFLADPTLQEALPEAGDATPGETPDLTTAGEIGLRFFNEMAGCARRIDLTGAALEFSQLILPFSCWLVHNGAEILNLEPAVDALAAFANRLHDPQDLARLFEFANDLVEGTNPRLPEDPRQALPGQPWRTLLTNRAIVATRTHRPELMRLAFDDLLEWLPEAAPEFFAEGMEQMEALNYPAAVRELMFAYYRRAHESHRLH